MVDRVIRNWLEYIGSSIVIALDPQDLGLDNEVFITSTFARIETRMGEMLKQWDKRWEIYLTIHIP